MDELPSSTGSVALKIGIYALLWFIYLKKDKIKTKNSQKYISKKFLTKETENELF